MRITRTFGSDEREEVLNMEDLHLILTPREVKMREHARLMENKDFLEREDRTCPRCRQGWLDEWTGICSACGYPEVGEDEPCSRCEDGDCDRCEYARKLREKIVKREEWWRRVVRGRREPRSQR